MKKIITTVIVILITLILCSCGNGRKLFSTKFSEDPESISDTSMSVVLLNCYNRRNELCATGSAFQCLEDGVFVTNYHVIEDADSIQAQVESGVYFDIDEILAVSEEKDIAILKTNADPKLNVLQIGDCDSMVKGENVVAIGNPEGFINIVSKGTYSGTTSEFGVNLLQFNASVSHGSSGGALFNDKGEVIGITSATYEGGQNLNFAIPISEAFEMWTNLDEYKPPEKPKWITVAEYWEDPDKYEDSEVLIGGYISGKPTWTGHNAYTDFAYELWDSVGSIGDYESDKNLILVHFDKSSNDLISQFEDGDFIINKASLEMHGYKTDLFSHATIENIEKQ